MNYYLNMTISLKDHINTIIHEVEAHLALLIELYPNVHDMIHLTPDKNTHDAILARKDPRVHQQVQKIKTAFDGLNFDQTKIIHAIMIVGKSHEKIGKDPNITIKNAFNTVTALDKEESINMMTSKIGNENNNLAIYLKNGMHLLHL